MTRGALVLMLLVAVGCAADEADAVDASVVRDSGPDRQVDAPVDAPRGQLDVGLDIPSEPAPEVASEAAADMPETCESLLRSYTEIVNRADRTCASDTDCLLDGDSNGSCEGLGLSIMCGVAVNARAFPAVEVAPLRTAAYRLGCRGNYDCGSWEASCVAGRCTAKQISGCFRVPDPARDGG